MTPILFPSDATDFTTQGLGALSAAISCTVTEERNGMYELELVYPVTGVHFAEIQDECLIYAIPSPYRSAQPFRIYRHTKPMSGKVTFYARHISYDLLDIPLNPCSAGSAGAAMVALQSHAALPSPFVFWTDKDTVADWSVKVPSKSRSVLGGQTGSILDVYGGEFEWDGFTVKLHQERGRDNGVTIRYGKNLTDLEQDRNISNVFTGIYPYWTDANGENLVVCDPPIINAPGTYKRTRVAPVDFSADFDEAPTPEQLKARAETYVEGNKIGVPSVSITASFVQLEQAMGYEHLALLEKVDLCDTVAVQYEELGVDATAKVLEIETDVLRGRYNKVTLGDAKSTLTDTIINQGQEIQQRPTQSDLQQAISNATKWITNGKGYMVPVFDASGNWSELVSLDRQSLTEAQNVWRWNNAGFGHSSTGYNGPYRTAITQDGQFVADFITTGTLNAALVKIINLIADRIVSESGAYKLEEWAAIASIKENDKLRLRWYCTGNGLGIYQCYSGNTDAEGNLLGSDARYSYLTPDAMGAGQDATGKYTGTVYGGRAYFAQDINADEVQATKFRPGPNQNALTVDWKRGSELTQNDWVLVGH